MERGQEHETIMCGKATQNMKRFFSEVFLELIEWLVDTLTFMSQQIKICFSAVAWYWMQKKRA